MSENQVVKAEPKAITPMDMLHMAVSQGADLDKLEKLMALQERWEASEAKKAYVVAMNAFKADPPTIYKTKNVSYTGVSYNHALLEDAAELIGSAMTKHGLSFRWDCEQLDGGLVRVTCIITHLQGHSERTALQAGIDLSGKKNNIQALGSTVSYLQRYTLFAATGMASKEMDDDGKGLEESKYIDTEQVEIIRKEIANAGSNETAVLDFFKAESIEKFPLQAYEDALLVLGRKIADKQKMVIVPMDITRQVVSQSLMCLANGDAHGLKQIWDEFNADEQVFMWKKFDSTQRSEMKKLTATLKEEQK